jgi:hypothetical protein
MYDVKLFLTFTSLNLVLLWQLFYLLRSNIVTHTVIVTAGTFEPKNIFLTFFLTSLSLYMFIIWKCTVYYRLCRDGIYFDKILVSEYKPKSGSLRFSDLRLFTDFVCLYTYEFWLSLCNFVITLICYISGLDLFILN